MIFNIIIIQNFIFINSLFKKTNYYISLFFMFDYSFNYYFKSYISVFLMFNYLIDYYSYLSIHSSHYLLEHYP